MAYKPTRTRNLYDPASKLPYRLSRSKLELFQKCPRCFYFDRRLGVGIPQGPAFTLNSAVDNLLKKEFDSYRQAGKPHPLMVEHGIDAVPFAHADLEKWRDALRGGLEHHHVDTNLLVTGGIDDLWVKPTGEVVVVDYKATAKNGEITLDSQWQQAYKRQVEIYQWLLQKMGFTVCSTAYFVYCNGQMDRDEFGSKLEFKIKLIPYEADTSWVEQFVREAHKCLNAKKPPKHSETCEMWAYRAAASQHD